MANYIKDIANVLLSPREALEGRKLKRELENVLSKGMKRQEAQRAAAQIASKFEGLKQADIKRWRTAYALALNTDNPIRSELYGIYKDTLLNDHLISVIQIRIETLLKNEFHIVDEESEEAEPELTKLLNKSWFWQFMTVAWESKLYGFSLIQFGDLFESNEPGVSFEFKDVEAVNRSHIKPEWGIIVREPQDDKGFDYRKPPLSNWLLEVGDKKSLGLLLEATPLAISNKYMGIFWDEFAEMFAAPIRVGKTNTNNDGERTKMAEMLEQMGRNAWGVFDHDTDIEIIETQKKDAYMVYDKRMDRNNKGMSKRVLGTTMITEDGASLSQSQVHQDITEAITDSDKRFMLFTINEQLIPFLTMHGYPFEGKKFKWDDSESLGITAQAEIDKWLIQYFDIDIEYFRKRYNANIVDFKKTTVVEGTVEGK